MSKITVTTTPKNRISINSQQRGHVKIVRAGGGGGSGVIGAVDTLEELRDVDASSLSNNETVVYDEVSGKFVIKELPIINGGTF